MTLRPNRPWIEFLALGVILYFVVRFIQLTVDKNDLTIVIPVLFFLAMGLIAAVWTNKEYRTYELSDKLILKGLFWGQIEIGLNQIKGFRIKERKEGRYTFHTVFDILISVDNNKTLTIREGNYNGDSINQFKERLIEKGISFTGTEKFSWKESFYNFLKLKWFE